MSFEQDGTGVTAVLQTRRTGTARTLQADYLPHRGGRSQQQHATTPRNLYYKISMIEVIMAEYFCIEEPLRIIVASSSIMPQPW
jgi:hypothetical protein